MEGAVFSGKLCAKAVADDWNASDALPSPRPAATKEAALA